MSNTDLKKSDKALDLEEVQTKTPVVAANSKKLSNSALRAKALKQKSGWHEQNGKRRNGKKYQGR